MSAELNEASAKIEQLQAALDVVAFHRYDKLGRDRLALPRAAVSSARSALNHGGTRQVPLSPAGSNGHTWEARQNFASTLVDVAFFSGQFVAVGDAGLLLTSPDGAVSTARAAPTTGLRFGSGPMLWTSPDGLFWQERNIGAHQGFVGLAVGNDRYLGLGQDFGSMFTRPRY